MKELWGRARPYEIGHDGAHFTNWLTINGNTGHSSFPSGHTTDAAYLMFWAFYFKTRVAQKRMFIIAFMFTIIMCVSRLRIGTFLRRCNHGLYINYFIDDSSRLYDL